MDPLVQELRDLLEQTEPFQRKMKAGHSRKKKRVIGYGKQSAGPPYNIKPSMERSKSAPPIGENVVFTSLDEGLWSTLSGMFKKQDPKFTQIQDNIYVGQEPLSGNKLDTQTLNKFDKIYLIAPSTIQTLGTEELKKHKDQVLTPQCSIEDQTTISEEQYDEMERIAKEIANTPNNVAILVACKYGLNRSTAIAARALVLRKGIDKVDNDQKEKIVNDIIQLMKSKRGTEALTYSMSGELPHSVFINFIKGTKDLGQLPKGAESDLFLRRKPTFMTESIVLETLIKEVIREILK